MKSLMWVKNITKFLRFCYLNIPCLRIIITLIFMNSSSDEFSICRKNQRQMFLLVSGSHIGAPQMDTNMASSYKVLKAFFWIFCIQNIAQTWFLVSCLDIHLIFPRFWTLCTEWFAFLFSLAWHWKQRICSPAIVCYTTISSVFTQCSWRGALHAGTKNGFVAD